MKRGIIFTKLSASLLAGGCMLCLPVKTTAQGILKQVARSAAQRTASTAINKTLGVSATKDTVILPGARAIQTTSFTPVESYSQYDFVPGQSVLFLEDFSNASIGELPLGWNSNGSGVAVTVSNAPGKWLKLGQQSVYLAPNKLPAGENFTIEFDLILQFTKSGAKGFPVVRFGALSTLKGIAPTDNSLLRTQEGKTKFQVTLQPDEKQKSSVMLESWKAGKYHISEAFKRYPGIESTYGKVAHIAIQVQRERLRIWYNGDKLYELPKGIAPEGAFNQLFFSLGSSSYTEQEQGVYISNIKMANGLADTRKNLLDKGSYSTTGILFDVNSAHIQPASSGVLNELAGILQENPDMKVKITGHTDADGNPAANKTLSINRANAIKEAFVKNYNISEDRLLTDGKGAGVPVASNTTVIGKAQNRRVEFTKL